MSWASRRRATYTFGVTLFFLVVIGGPVAYHFLTIPPTCNDGKQNQGETAIDKGGPCLILDERALAPTANLWSRSFRVRAGSYNAVAYIQNPNANAGAINVPYTFGLYDDQNVLVAERRGVVSIMPGVITPVFEGAIDTGNRVAVHTYLEFNRAPVWERLTNAADPIKVSSVVSENLDSTPRVSAIVENQSVADIKNIEFVAVLFDGAGNAFASSQTALDQLSGGEKRTIFFTWPDPLHTAIGRIDILPVVQPAVVR